MASTMAMRRLFASPTVSSHIIHARCSPPLTMLLSRSHAFPEAKHGLSLLRDQQVCGSPSSNNSPSRLPIVLTFVSNKTAKIFANQPLRAKEASPYVSTKYPVIVCLYLLDPNHTDCRLTREPPLGPRVRCRRCRCRWIWPTSRLWSSGSRIPHRLYLEIVPNKKSHRRCPGRYQRGSRKHA